MPVEISSLFTAQPRRCCFWEFSQLNSNTVLTFQFGCFGCSTNVEISLDVRLHTLHTRRLESHLILWNIAKCNRGGLDLAAGLIKSPQSGNLPAFKKKKSVVGWGRCCSVLIAVFFYHQQGSSPWKLKYDLHYRWLSLIKTSLGSILWHIMLQTSMRTKRCWGKSNHPIPHIRFKTRFWGSDKVYN